MRVYHNIKKSYFIKPINILTFHLKLFKYLFIFYKSVYKDDIYREKKKKTSEFDTNPLLLFLLQELANL